jgi:DNA-3-methyladenine glycosylase
MNNIKNFTRSDKIVKKTKIEINKICDSILESRVPSKKKQKSENPKLFNNYVPIQRDFFMTDAVTLSKRLLGKIIVRKLDDSLIKCRIVEVEAYMGGKDKGSHTYQNKKTERTKYFWNPGGYLYVYLIYGTNHCFNIVANDSSLPQACLIRAVEPLNGFEIISQNRQKTNKKKYVHSQYNLTNGPGKVCSALKIDRTYNGHDVCNSSELFLIEDNSPYKFKIKTSPRINIDYAEEYKDKLWRFFIKDNSFVSKNKYNN